MADNHTLFKSQLAARWVGTALVAITDDLQNFVISSWIVTSYLLTYTGFLTVLAKLSDTFGRRNVMAHCIILFIIFSVACGVAKTMLQLIVFRAVQGIGGGGMYTMAFVLLPEMVPPSQYALYSGMISGVAALAHLLGLIFGGVISNNGKWPWIFLLNAPPGFVALILFCLLLPAHFPFSKENTEALINIPLTQKLRRIDSLGLLLLLSSGIGYPCNGGLVLSLLIVSFTCMVGLVAWSKLFTRRLTTVQEPVLPWMFLSSRYVVSLLFTCFFTGLGFLTSVFEDTSATAGFRLLAMTLSVPCGAGAAGYALQTMHSPPLYVFLGEFSFMILGTGLSTIKTHLSGEFPKEQYGLQIIMGLGFGINMAAMVMAAPLAFSQRDLGTLQGQKKPRSRPH
ncbi:MFS general substrate transporter [Periconia macrospinosa]|uniref:MFS general substrate transporter n=1 Tax=Periconia macrospinosa TaxID=97972 RepID=A0A2V1E0X5_9PLEO|nr:MFS general substrate transporter [Periconia macrospinosa]